MSSKFEPDLAVDTNISHTVLQDNVRLSPNALKTLVKKACPCTLREIFHSHLKPIDITKYSIEIQLEILTCLVSKRYNSTCFTEDDNTISIKCFLSSDREICISNWSATQEETSKFQSETSKIPVHSKVHLACLVTDHHYVQNIIEQEPRTDLKTLLFYGISCGDIVTILVEKGAKVNARDERGRTPLFYAITSSLDSARRLLDKGAGVALKDKCSVSVLTLFVENMLKNDLPTRPMEDKGFQLLSTKGITQEKLVKEVINLFFCKFFQCYLDHSLLCKTLKWILGQNDSNADEINALINQLESTSPDDTVTFDAVQPIFDILHKLGAKPSSRDSEGNTCLHYAIRSIFQGVSPKNITCLFEKLMELDAKLVDAKNHKKETPLLFCLSSKFLIAHSPPCKWFGNLHAICKVLVEKGSELRHTTHCKEESVFQLILKVCQHAILQDENQTRCIFKEMFKILELFSNETNKSKVAAKKRDVHSNSPLHLWASLALKPDSQYCDNVYDDQSFKNLLKKTLDLLLKCGVKLDDINEKNQKPLHMCRTWTAVKLLLEAGASPNGTDSSECTPLLAAAMKNTCLKNGANRFYPDITEDPIEFWKEVIERKLDPWTADKNGDSVLSILIEKEAVRLAETLVEVACEQNYVQSDKIGVPLLAAICRDISNDKRWKFDLVKKLLDTKRSLVNGTLNGDTPIRFSCKNILESDENDQTSVHWKIVEHLRLCGADIPSDLSSNRHVFGNLLSTPVDYTKMPPVLKNWKQSSEKHAQQLSLVARMVNYQKVNTLYFCKEALDKDKGSFGFVFTGIVQSSGSREDGREVAVKRIDKSNMPNKSGSESVVLLPQTYSEHIVQCFICEQDSYFHYIAFELMEGDLEDYLAKIAMPRSSRCEETTKLCKQLVIGLKFLHSECIVHGNINPRTVFYQSKPNLCLKIGNCQTRRPRRGWVPAEMEMDKPNFSNESDMFSCGLVLHYLMSGKKHPFAPDDDLTTKTQEDILHETEENILNNNIVKLDDSLSPEATDPLSPEATDLVQLMIDKDTSIRPSAAEALVHPFFWENETKKKFLHAVGNQPEIAKQTKKHPLTAFETELENRFSTIVTRGSEWNDPGDYPNISNTYAGMIVRPNYNYSTIAGLIRFIRNAYEHINEQTDHIQEMWGGNFVLTDDYFPHLVIEVYKALTRSDIHQLHQSRNEIKTFFEELR